ncbi:Stomatin [uncultured archaeon]|nr:Stomatin [uncultured archaeon]
MAESDFKEKVFIGVVLLVALAVIVVLKFSSEFASALPLLVVLAAILFLVRRYNYLLMLSEYERAVIFRFGKVNRVAGPGWAFLVSPFENYKLVDLRTKTLDVPPQEVITKDNIEVRVDAVIYLKVNKDRQSVINSVTEVDDYLKGTELFVIGLIRNQAGTKTLDELITNVESLSDYLKVQLAEISTKWGISIENATITEVTPPKSVQEARHEQEVAAQRKLARMESAEAHKAEIDAVREAAGQLSDKALAYYYVKALEKLGEGQSSKIFFPMELTELAKAVTSRVSFGPQHNASVDQGASSGQQGLEALFRKYAPLLKKIASQGTAKRKAGKRENAKGKAKKKRK